MVDVVTLFDLGAPDFSGDTVIHPVSRLTADSWFGKYHYSGTSGAVNSAFYGIFEPDMVAVVGIGFPANEHGLSKRYALEAWDGNMEVTRVAVHPTAPRNSASRCVSAVLGRCVASQGIDWVFSYSDTGQNHHGGIYQALNAVYVGLSAERHGFLLDGEPVHPRVVVHMYGTQARVQAIEIARTRGQDLEWVDGMNSAKHTYILPISRDKRVRQAIRDHLAPYSKPYPKREVAASSDAPVYQIEEGGSQPTPPLQLSVFG